MSLPVFFPVLLEFILLPAILFASGFSFLGVFAVPALTAVRAFLLSYAISVFYRACGISGIAASAGVFALHILVSIPALFAVGSAAFSASFSRFSSRMETAGHLFERTLISSVCAAILILAALLQWSFMPRVFREILTYII